MAITVGCSDFNQPCDFRITANDDESKLLVDVATTHALKRHPKFADTEAEFRNAIRGEIKRLMAQAHSSLEDIEAV